MAEHRIMPQIEVCRYCAEPLDVEQQWGAVIAPYEEPKKGKRKKLEDAFYLWEDNSICEACGNG
jgi:hypothetical protein